jgi:uncharacterized SAM-binding protein YcdF (DUF218 family)
VFYVLSKTLDLLVAPLTWAFVLILAGVWGAHRKRPRLASRALLGAAGVLYVFSIAPIANAMVLAMEAGATNTASPTTTYDVVIVLGGLVTVQGDKKAREFNEGVDRLLAAYDIIRHEGTRYVLVTSSAEETSVLSGQLADWGVPTDRIVVEDRSRNTRENAVNSAAIIRARGWSRILLVTSAMHMPRAAGCFRAVGLSFDTLPVDHLAQDPAQVRARLDPRADELSRSTAAIREAVGRVIYQAIGYAR